MSEISASSVTDLLFVYGTLRRGHINAVAHRLHRCSTYVGSGWFSGRLYRIDWFPGAVYDSSTQTRVWGEVFRLQAVADTVRFLDVYEGVDDNPPVYCRRPVPVHLPDRIAYCQTYLYALPTSELLLIESGQFHPPS